MKLLNNKAPSTPPLPLYLEPKSYPIDWAAFGPTMDGRQIELVCKFSRSKRFELISKSHPRRDPSFPPSFTLSGGRGAKRLWWTSDIAAWLEQRAANSKTGGAA